MTNPHTNRTKKAKNMDEFLDKYGNGYTESQKDNMRRKDAIARKAYESKLAREYYTSPKFAKDVTAAAGALSSLTTTLCNIFFSTSKNVVRIIRQSYASIVEAGKVLFINPDNYAFGDRMEAVVKILATGASVVVGAIVSDALGKTPIGAIPALGDVVKSFCGAFVTGILSCTLLYFIDGNEMMQRLFCVLNSLHTIETEINYYRQQAEYFERYAAELMNIDLGQFKKETMLYRNVANKIEGAKTEGELNGILRQAVKDLGIAIPWKGNGSFDEFMGDKTAHLVFE